MNKSSSSTGVGSIVKHVESSFRDYIRSCGGENRLRKLDD